MFCTLIKSLIGDFFFFLYFANLELDSKWNHLQNSILVALADMVLSCSLQGFVSLCNLTSSYHEVK